VNKELLDLTYIVASILFIFGLKMLGKSSTAARGNRVSALGMLIAVAATLSAQGLSYTWIVAGMVIGAAIGAWAARTVKMTAMPEMVALFNGSGGLASLLVAGASYLHTQTVWSAVVLVPLVLAALIGGVTFTGSIVAYLKLSEKVSGKPFLFSGQQVVNGLLILALLVVAVLFTLDNSGGSRTLLWTVMALSFVLGVMVVVPIGGADMPVVISLLNSYSGLAACAAGFVIHNNVLIVSGALVGASGIILTQIMCKAMNRSLSNVLFSGFGSGASSTTATSYKGEAKPISADDAYFLLEAATSVVFVPGYGMAVAQAQHAVKELSALLEKNGCEVRFVIHPVAGRMPGHMNVLLAEADVPYEQLVVPDDVNPTIASVDVAIVVGANDVVNPAARTETTSPLYGMPVVNVDQARTCIVLKRSLKAGFAGVDNPLFFAANTRMLLGDAKESIQALVAGFKGT